MIVQSAPRNLRGFDCNAPISHDVARQFMQHGYRFAIRYVPRVKQSVIDLTSSEVSDLLLAGLGVMPVQHVEPEGWTPSLTKGQDYGQMAAESATKCGIAPTTSLWLDVEGIQLGTAPSVVIQYCNAWYDAVAQGGFTPGIYVGWRCVLTPDQLYRRLKFTRYWSAYNLDTDQFPAVVGVCMKQGEAKTSDRPPSLTYIGWHAPFDTDLVVGDAQKRFPLIMSPAEWDLTVC